MSDVDLHPWEDGSHYVYLYMRLDGRPLYVGCGTGARWRQHQSRKTNAHLWSVIQQAKRAGGALPVIVLEHGITQPEALAAEIRWIAHYGREKAGTGPLVNMTDGGEGTVGYREPKSPEHRAKIGAGNKGKVMSPESIEKGAAKKRGRKRLPEHVEKSAAAQRGKKRSPEGLKNMRAVFGSEEWRAKQRGPKHSPAARAEMSRTRKGRKLTPEQCEARKKPRGPMSDRGLENLQASWTPERREVARQNALAQHARMTPEEKAARSEKISVATKEAMTPEVCAKIGNGMKAGKNV